MKTVNKGVFPVTGVTLIVVLNDFSDDEPTVKYMVTNDNKQILILILLVLCWKNKDVQVMMCSLIFLRCHMTLSTLINLVIPKLNWKDKMKEVLNRSSFDSIIKMLELNTGYRISFVVERIDVQLLKRYFEGLTFVFST